MSVKKLRKEERERWGCMKVYTFLVLCLEVCICGRDEVKRKGKGK